jgi:hypothetical protein
MVGGIKPRRETRTRSSTARRRPVAVLTTVGDPTVSPPAAPPAQVPHGIARAAG